MARLTNAELEVMQILWREGEQKPREMLDNHPRRISNSTLRTFLADLMSKGHVTRIRRGKAYYYRAKTRPESAFRSKLGQIVDYFFDGSSAALAMHLVSWEKLKPTEVADLRQLLDQKYPDQDSERP